VLTTSELFDVLKARGCILCKRVTDGYPGSFQPYDSDEKYLYYVCVECAELPDDERNEKVEKILFSTEPWATAHRIDLN